MGTKVPIRAEYSGNTPIGFSEYQTDDYVGAVYGGTGHNTFSINDILLGNSLGSLDKRKLVEGTGITIVNDGSNLTINSTAVGVTASDVVLGMVKVPSNSGIKIDGDGSITIKPGTPNFIGGVRVYGDGTGGIRTDEDGGIVHSTASDGNVITGQDGGEVISELTIDQYGHVSKWRKKNVDADGTAVAMAIALG